MSIKRRKFLILGSLSGLGIAALGKIFHTPITWINNSDRIANATPTGEATPSTSADALSNAAAETLSGLPLLRFVSLADTGTGAQGQHAVAKAMTQYHQQNPFPFAILAGDNIYNDGEIEKINLVFERPYQPLLQQDVKFYAVLGNHDIRTANGDPQVRYPGFNMQGRYYTFRQDPVQYFALDTNHNAAWEAQLAWLEEELSRSDTPWKVVVGHHQLYSSGHYGFNDALVPKLTPLFQKHGVQLYINGHDHHYERTRSLNGTTYLTCGSGAGVREARRSEWTEHSAMRLGFAAFDVYADKMVVKGIGTDGNVFDQGIIQRQFA